MSACASAPASKPPHLVPSSALQWAPLNPKEPASGELSLIFGDLKEQAPAANGQGHAHDDVYDHELHHHGSRRS